jgi:hypothetical protein
MTGQLGQRLQARWDEFCAATGLAAAQGCTLDVKKLPQVFEYVANEMVVSANLDVDGNFESR